MKKFVERDEEPIGSLGLPIYKVLVGRWFKQIGLVPVLSLQVAVRAHAWLHLCSCMTMQAETPHEIQLRLRRGKPALCSALRKLIRCMVSMERQYKLKSLS